MALLARRDFSASIRKSSRGALKEIRMAHRFLPTLLMLAAASAYGQGGGDAIPKIAPDDFERLLRAIKPQQGESPWREITWLTNVTEARQQALAEDKPIVIFTAADGSPLSRT